MTVEELLAREAIRHTISSYNIAGDRLRVNDYVALFTPDGVIEGWDAKKEHVFRFEGRESIRAWMARWSDRTAQDADVHQASFVRHHLTTSKIEIIGTDTASATTYWVAWTDIGPDHAGYYSDAFRKVDGQWLIAHRRVREDWRSHASLFETALTNSQ